LKFYLFHLFLAQYIHNPKDTAQIISFMIQPFLRVRIVLFTQSPTWIRLLVSAKLGISSCILMGLSNRSVKRVVELRARTLKEQYVKHVLVHLLVEQKSANVQQTKRSLKKMRKEDISLRKNVCCVEMGLN